MHIELIKNWLQIRNTSKIKRTYLIYIDLTNEPNKRVACENSFSKFETSFENTNYKHI